MPRTVINSFVKILLLAVLVWGSIHGTQAQKVVCPNFQAGHDSLNKLIAKHLPVDSAKTLYFQFGWAVNNLRLYSNVIVDFEDIMPYAFYKEVENGFVYVSTEKLQYFYMQYEYGSGISKCWIRNTALENPPERKPKPVIKEEIKKDTTLVISSKTAQIHPALKHQLQELKKENAGKGSGEGYGTGSPGNRGGTGSHDGRGSTYKPKQQIEVIEDDEIDDDVEIIAPAPQIRTEKEE